MVIAAGRAFRESLHPQTDRLCVAFTTLSRISVSGVVRWLVTAPDHHCRRTTRGLFEHGSGVQSHDQGWLTI